MVNTRQLSILGFTVILTALVSSYGLEFMGYEPCILCLVQRYCLFVIAGLFLAAIFHYHNQIWQKRYWVASIFVTLVGLAAVGRQLYLQNLPHDADTLCLPGVRFFWETGNYSQIFKVLMMGTQECGQVSTTILGLSFAAWSGLFLLGVLLLIVALFIANKRNQ